MKLRRNRRARVRCGLQIVCALLTFCSLVMVMVHLPPWRTPLLGERASSEATWFSLPITSRFVIGSFLKDSHPAAESFCTFPYGKVENFSIPEEMLTGSPELGEKSPYRVLYNAVVGKSVNDTNHVSVSFVTHATLEYMVHIAEMARAWEGVVSVACYLPGADMSRALRVLETLCYCESAMRNVSVHVVFHLEHTPNVTSFYNNASDSCLIPKYWLRSTRLGHNLPYPVNVARNVARQGARTKNLLVADIELFPSAGLAQGFLEMREKLPARRLGDHSFLKKRHVFVIPVFEVVSNVRRLPRTKQELLRLHSLDKAVYFHRFICRHCQLFPGLQQWLQRRGSPRRKSSTVQPMTIVKREFPHHRWEPIYIGSHREPLYSELLTWEGQQDKMTQMFEMCLLDYRFVILDGAFLVHTPGIKRRKTKPTTHLPLISNGTMQPLELQDQVKRNSYLYNIITNDLADRYDTNKKCRRV